ncbi:MAG TPA: thioredoxin family protein [Solirubrobacteraceae bacterium]|nr:thioredoxin family protein [Solirubrobacteraceae bacterium]
MADSTRTRFHVGDPVPAFSLPDTDGLEHSVPLEDAPPATVLVVTCNHCPYVIAWNPRLRRVAEEYAERDVRFLAINANDASRYPADSLDHMRRFVRDQDWPIPYLHDESQEVARALGAEVTPHVFMLDSDQRLAYRGAPDADHRDESQDAAWLRAALDGVLAGEPLADPETRARGCSVKWRG